MTRPVSEAADNSPRVQKTTLRFTAQSPATLTSRAWTFPQVLHSMVKERLLAYLRMGMHHKNLDAKGREIGRAGSMVISSDSPGSSPRKITLSHEGHETVSCEC